MSRSSPQASRKILHIALHELFVSVERKHNPKLRKRPVLIGNQGNRSVVIACCEQARAMGITPGLPIRRALHVCPEAVLCPGNLEAYSQHSQQVAELLAQRVPLYEVATMDSFFVEVTGMERFHGVETFVRQLGNAIFSATALPLRLGLAPNKLLAQIASGEAGVNRVLHLSSENVREFLAPLSVHKLPGVGKEITRQLSQLGIRQIGELQRIPRLALVQTFGKLGHQLYEKAMGQDDRLLCPPQENPQLSEVVTFDPECDDPAQLLRMLTQLIESLGFQLRQRNLLATRLGLRLHYASGESENRRAKVAFSASDEVLLNTARPLLHTLYQRRMRIRKLTLQLTGLLPGQPQLMLFQSQARQVELYHALDHLREKYGLKVARRASSFD